MTLDVPAAPRASDPSYCVVAKACTLRGAFRRATEAFLAVLDRYSLEDLVRPRNALSTLLGITPTPKAPRGSWALDAVIPQSRVAHATYSLLTRLRSNNQV